MSTLHGLNGAMLLAIGCAWLVCWRDSVRWVGRSGVTDHAAQWAIGCIVPTAALILSVHLPALVSLCLGVGLVHPLPITSIMLGMTIGWHWYSASERRDSTILCPVSQNTISLGPVWLPLLVVSAMYLVFLLDAVSRYPTGYDAMYYHLPNAVRWTQQQNMRFLPGFHFLAFPENAMIVPSLLIFAGWEWLLPIVHLPKGLLVAVAVWGLARSLGVSRRGAWASSCIVLSVPLVVFQCFSGYVDLYAAAAWLTSLLTLTWALRVSKNYQQYRLLVLVGVGAGIALGSKTTYLVLVALLIGLVWITSICLRGIGRRRPWRAVGVVGLASLMCSGFWFIRAAVETGNPVYPLGVSIAGRQILPGFEHDDIFPNRTMTVKLQKWWDYPWRETKFSGTGYPYSVNNGLGAAYATFVVPGFLASLVLIWWRVRSGQTDPTTWWLGVLSALSLIGALLLLTVFREMLRFVFPLLLLPIPVAAVMVDRVLTRFPRTASLLLTFTLGVTACIAVYSPAHDLAVRVKHGLWNRTAYYRLPPQIDELPPGTRIINAGDPFWNYPLLGRRLDHIVISLQVWIKAMAPEGITAQSLRRNRIAYISIDEPPPPDWPFDLPLQRVPLGPDSRSPLRLYRVRTK